MRMLATALVVGFLAVPIGGAQARVSDLAHEGLKGPVRSVREEVAPLATRRGRLVEGKRQLASIARFDVRGDQSERTRFVQGRAVERSIYRYVPDGSLVCESHIRSTGTVFTLVAATADAPAPDESSWRVDRHILKRTYDRTGHAVETVAYDEVGASVVARTREAFAYDEAGRLVAVDRHSLDTGETIGRVRYGYLPSGHLAWTEIYAGAETLERRVEYADYRADARGNWVRRNEVEYAAGNVRERRAVYRSIEYYGDTPRVSQREGRFVAKATHRRGADSELAKARSAQSDGMGDARGLFLAVRDASIANRKKPCKTNSTADVADDATTTTVSDEPAVDGR
jgi:hypothetical protein